MPGSALASERSQNSCAIVAQMREMTPSPGDDAPDRLRHPAHARTACAPPASAWPLSTSLRTPSTISRTLRMFCAASSGILDVEFVFQREKDVDAIQRIDLQFLKVLSIDILSGSMCCVAAITLMTRCAKFVGHRMSLTLSK